jgi:hypothetical protein
MQCAGGWRARGDEPCRGCGERAPDDQEPEPPHQNERTAADGGTYFVTFTVRASEKRTRPEPPANPPSGRLTPFFLTVVSGDAFSVP